ncbi:polysaccharide biosynthesis tyrosine autokinase [Alysiella crassa]|uniref:Putative tyrosine-protein kinase EpsB n=1 Tax=Alysiella crassa TaxID=153491 RepID=A0A376BKW3_9NEIS|nr:polysaccharide biosynthesis tyrosine autokinase [Alysiella crassa]UOP07467.1 polysaccharide biosynthesis tyrosine autokinase [Alysiella crassa]SSY70341.1 Tyrosine-protein kinase wzc [Alysiella crassa]
MTAYSRSARSQQPKPSQPSHSIVNDDEIDLAQLFGVLWYHKWRILVITVVAAVLGVAYAISATPVYQANGMVEFSNKKNQVLGDLSEIMGSTKTPADSEVDMIKSRLVLGQTVRDLNLHIDVSPITPSWQRFLNALPPKMPNAVKPNLTVETFRLPEDLLDTPFVITTLSPKSYSLTLPNEQVLTGQVGQILKINNDGELLISQITANVGQQFSLVHYSDLNSIDNIHRSLTVATKSKNSPMIGLSLTGTDPEKIKLILDRIMENYAAEDRNKDIQAASSGLRFIDEELPRLKDTLHEAENALNTYRSRSGSVDVPHEAKGILENLNKIEMQLVDLRTEQAVLNEVYTRDHPSQQALSDKIRILNEAKSKLNTQITKMPSLQQDIIRLTRNVEINQGIYVQLLSKQQELNILKASSQGNVRIIDAAAVPKKPIKPKKLIIVALATILGAFMGVAFYLLRTLLNRGIHTEDEIEALGLDVIVSIPASDAQTKRDRVLKKVGKRKHIRSNSMLALKDPTDMAVEALRALRTNLFFRTMSATNKVIMISGATPEVGKSFVAANLAVLMAQSDKKVLLIDGDMRKGYMHHLMQIPSGEGLSEILANKDDMPYNHRIWKMSLPNLHFLSGGSTPNNPSELLLNGRLGEFLAWADAHYDYVVLDTPPVLAVTDAAVMGQHAGVTLLVSRFGKTNLRELDACVARFEAGNVRISGIVLNGVERTASNYYSYDGYADKYGKYSKDGKK